jgi:hypothetical protein
MLGQLSDCFFHDAEESFFGVDVDLAVTDDS